MAGQLRPAQKDWLEARLDFRNAAKQVMFLKTLYPQGTEHDEGLEQRVYHSYKRHSDTAYALLRKTISLWEVEDPYGVAGTLPVDVQVEGERGEIASLTFALERNEAMIKTLHKALDVLLAYIAHERQLLQESHREQLEGCK